MARTGTVRAERTERAAPGATAVAAPETVPAEPAAAAARYRLEEQVGFLLRRATQRHLAIFARGIPDLTPTQFAALAKLARLGPASQNRLGRETAMDAATIKGVIERLEARGLVATRPDAGDRRRVIVEATEAGLARFAAAAPHAVAISAETLAPLSPAERQTLLALLARIA